MIFNFLYLLVNIISQFVDRFGYWGIFVMTFIENTFIPIPSEITLIPAGYLISKGDMSLFPVLIYSSLGTLLGSLFNYSIAYKYGRYLFLRYGKYFFIKERKLAIIESFFHKYGNISTFLGRILPGMKHFISFPAGLAKMNLKLFCLFTLSGSFIWIMILIYLGYSIGNNKIFIMLYIRKINIFFCLFVLLIIIFIILKNKFLKL